MCLYVNRVLCAFITIRFSSHLIEPSVFNGGSGYSSVCRTVLMKIDFVKLTERECLWGGECPWVETCDGVQFDGVNLIVFLW